MSPPRLAIIPILSRVQSPLSDARGALIVCFYAYFTPKPVPAPGKHALVLCMRIPAICRHGGFVLQLSDIKLNEALSFNGSKGSRAVKNMVAAAMYNQNILPYSLIPLFPYSLNILPYCPIALLPYSAPRR
ncbi:predicted protein [Brucella abortus bv. 3 str. Tulya]|nr:predicted protein [Brucella abortus bv. 3 str. Tulya]